MIKTAVIATLIAITFCPGAMAANVDLIQINFDDESCPTGVVNDDDRCLEPAPGRACRRPGQQIIWQAAPGPNRPQFTIQPKDDNPIVGCSLTSNQGATLNCRIDDNATPGTIYEYGIANTAIGCPLDPHIFISR